MVGLNGKQLTIDNWVTYTYTYTYMYTYERVTCFNQIDGVNGICRLHKQCDRLVDEGCAKEPGRYLFFLVIFKNREMTNTKLISSAVSPDQRSPILVMDTAENENK